MAMLSAGEYHVTPPTLTDGKTKALQLDVNGKLLVTSSSGSGASSNQVQGTAADGAATVGNPVQIAGKDGSGNTQTILTDTAGSIIPTAPIGGTYTDRSIANLSGASETLMAANANRRILIVHNIGATDVAVNLTGAAASLTVGGSIKIVAGGSLIVDHYPSTSAITIIGTLNADVTAYEG